MATDKTRTEWKEIPFGAGCLKHGLCINPHFIKYDRVIYKGDIDIALGVFDDLRGLCDLYAFYLVRTAVIISLYKASTKSVIVEVEPELPS